MTTPNNAGARWLLLAVIGLFVLGRFFGDLIGANAWSFGQWDDMGWLFPTLWLLAFVGLALLLYYRQEQVGRWFRSPVSVTVPLLVLITLFWVFRFDTILAGGGNLRVGDIARLEQTGGVVIYRWYEFGCTALAHGLYVSLKSFGLDYNTAGATAWRVLTYLSTVLAMLASVQLARIISRDSVRRVFTFIVVFFGGQTLLYFGYVGVEPIIVPVTLWFAYFVCRVDKSESKPAVVLLWLLLLAGMVLQFSTVFLLPAALYVTANAIGKTSRARIGALATGIVSYVVIVVVLYIQSSNSLGLQAYLLMLHGKAPFLDYGILSLRHIADLLQIFFLAVPTLIVVKWLSAQRIRKLVSDRTLMAGWLMALGGTTAVVILDPTNSIVIDLPRLLAYLAPFGFVAALVFNDVDQPGESQRLRLLPLVAVASIMFPLSYLPAYIDIKRADPYVDRYLARHTDYYKEACYSFRDAYFYTRDFDNSNRWEQAAERKSPERINLTGSAYLIGGGKFSEGIKTLYQLIARDRFWAEPRGLLARAHMAGGRYVQALPQIDTALMLDPYSRDPYVSRYECYRDMGKYDEALDACQQALELFPADTFMTTDLMILNYRARKFQTADSVADELINTNPRHAYARFIKGALADQTGDTARALKNYQMFLELAKDAPDGPRIRHRMRQLQHSEGQQPEQQAP